MFRSVSWPALLMTIMVSTLVHGKGADGSGGGNKLESAFRLRAYTMIDEISKIPDANALCPATVMLKSLNSTKIEVVTKLIDPVTKKPIAGDYDAWTSHGIIQLLKSSWNIFLDPGSPQAKDRSLDALILHEVYRSTAGKCLDDNSVISDQVAADLHSPDAPTPNSTITGISGVTSVVTIKPNFTEAFGGLAGTACIGDNLSTCNSCSATVTTSCVNAEGVDQFPLCACNTNRIYNPLEITVSVQRNLPNAGLVHMTTSGGSTVGLQQELPGSIPHPNSVTFPWYAVCSQIPGESSCEGVMGSQSVVLMVWVDNNGNGIYDEADDLIPVTFHLINPSAEENVYGQGASEGVGAFTPYSGDQRIYLTQMNTPPSFPELTNEGSVAAKIMAFYSTKGMDYATPQDGGSQALNTLPGGSVASTYITGVDNGKTYFTRLAVQDEAGNILQYFPGMTGLPGACLSPAATVQCPWAVIPAAP